MRADLALCEQFQISHSHFLGGPDEWTELDRAKAKAFRAYKNSRCPDCGTAPEEWVPKQGGHREAYIADVTFCPGCARIGEMRDSLDEAARKRGPHLHLRPRADVLAEEGLTDD